MSGLCVRTMCTLSFSQRGRQPEEVTGSPPGHKKSPDLPSEDSILVRDTGFEPARGRIFRAREAPINLSLAEGVSPRRSLVRPPGTQKIPGSNIRGFLNICARYWDRTSDLFRVREARYRCANRAQHYDVVRGEDGIRTRVHGFAGRCLTTRPPHRISLCERWGSEL